MLNPVYNLKEWIQENRDMLKPPVGNKLVYEDPDIIVMAVGGPNARKDFHYHDRGPELFYQVEGDIVLRVMDEKGPNDIHIKEGEIFLMPGNTIHSPQRPANTVGIVIELKGKNDEIDRLRWYCENCNHMLHQEEFNLSNIVTELPPIFEKFYSSKELRTCDKCNTVMDRPDI